MIEEIKNDIRKSTAGKPTRFNYYCETFRDGVWIQIPPLLYSRLEFIIQQFGNQTPAEGLFFCRVYAVRKEHDPAAPGKQGVIEWGAPGPTIEYGQSFDMIEGSPNETLNPEWLKHFAPKKKLRPALVFIGKDGWAALTTVSGRKLFAIEMKGYSESDWRRRLFEWADQNGYEITGEYNG